METLAYIHIACDYEASANIESNQSSDLTFLQGLNWNKFPSGVWFRLLSIFLSLSVLSVANSAMALRRGNSGPAVTDLQIRLNAAGYYSGPITGYYGRLTEAAVKKYQQAKGLSQVGQAGPQTYAKLRAGEGIVARTPNKTTNQVAIRSTGTITATKNNTVAQVQRQLVAFGYNPGPIDGIKGSKTQAALKKFQTEYRLVADGVIGKATLSALGLNGSATA